MVVAYADNYNGTGFSLNPRNKLYYGLRNQENISITASDDPSTFQWYEASPSFGQYYYLCYVNFTNRRFAFGTDIKQSVGDYYFPPDQSAYHPAALWSSLRDGVNVIDLDQQTGRLISVGTTDGAGDNDGILTVAHTGTGRVKYNLPIVFPDVDANGLKTFTGGSVTVDQYGRIRGLAEPDTFYMTQSYYTASYIISALLITSGSYLLTELGDKILLT
jgi:hypothetical protein